MMMLYACMGWEATQVSRFKCTPLKINSPVNLQQRNQLYYKVTPRVIVLWLPSHLATTALHCKVTPHFGLAPNKQ